jgi:hypothetical protein
MAQKQTLTAHCYVISFGVCSELLREAGRQGPKHVGDFIYIISVFECICWKLLFEMHGNCFTKTAGYITLMLNWGIDRCVRVELAI